jgi:hypothetical protein
MAEKSVAYSVGSSTTGLLGVLFVGLKLTHYIDWSWWYVTLPFWGGLAVAAVCLVALFALWVVCFVGDALLN